MNKFVTAATFTFTLLCSFSSSVQAQGSASLDAKLVSATDLRVPAGAMSLQLQRKLETGTTRRGFLGARWRLNWESRLSRNGRVAQIDDWTGVHSFTQVGQQAEYINTSGERISFSKDGRAVHTRLGGGSETFDANGRLIERAYRRGNKVSLRYDAQGRLSRVEGPGGSFLQFTADGGGVAIQVRASTGSTVRYTYDRDNLTEAQINGGASLRYGYDVKGSLVRIEDPQTGSLEISYDAKERPVSNRRADGSERRFEYDDATNTKRVIEPDGATTVTQESAEKRRTEVTDPLGNKSAVQFDEAGRPVIVTGPNGASSRISYDSAGRIAAAEDTLGQITRYEYAGDSSYVKAIIYPDGARQEFEYDGSNDLAAIKLGGKTVSALTHNTDGSIATAKEPGAKEQKFTYHPNGLTKSVANALGDTTQFEYDARGNLVRETNPLGGVTVRSYDAQDRLVSVTNAEATTRYEYDSRGRLIRETDPTGGATKFEYDSVGRLAAQTNAAGQVTRYEYSPVDKLIKTTWPDNTSDNYRYDLAGNLVERTDRLGRTFKFERDQLGRITRERSPSGLEVRYRYDAAGNLLGAEDSGGARSEYQNDVLGRATATVDPSGGKTQYQYDPLGNLSAVTDPLGRSKQFTLSADGDLMQVVEPSRDEARYEYDAAGRIAAIHRPSGGVTRFSNDGMGNPLTATDPLGNVKRYSYDNAGRLTSFTDATGRVTRYVYDKAGQRVEKQLPGDQRVAYKYDALGRMIEADDGAFPVRMSYDDSGNLQRVEYPAISKAVAYEYDAQGLRTKMIAPDARETRYEYDALKRLSALVLPDAKRITFAYDQKNRVQSAVYPNGLTGRWEYDASGRVAKITYQDKSGKAIVGSSYRYDLAGNPVERQDAQSQTTRFSYDPAGQLIEETNARGAIKYAYAAGGNRASVAEGTGITQYKHDAADQLIEAGAEQLSYDANGNLISRKGPAGAVSYEYDAENRPVKVVAADGATTTFGYAPTGERVWRRDKSGVTYFLYDGMNLIAELGGDFSTKATYVHGFGIDRPLAMLQGPQSYYYLTDRLGSVTHLTNGIGKVVAAYSYDAFGKIRTKQGTIANPFAFTGRELDPTGLYYFRARYYDASLGRFVSKDLNAAKLDEPLEQNPYLYVRNNPTSFVDPLGFEPSAPGDLNSLSTETLLQLVKKISSEDHEQIWRVLRSRGYQSTEADLWHYREGVRQPDGSIKWQWRPGSPPDLDGTPLPRTQPQQVVGRPPQQVVGRPAAAGNANPVETEALNPGANTGAVRPQPGGPQNNTLAVGEGRNGGDTLVSPAPGAPGSGLGSALRNQLITVNPYLMGAAGAASIAATAADCYRNGLEGCGGNIAKGMVVSGILAKAFGKAAGPIGTLISGAIAWKEVLTELSQGSTDEKQRKAQEDARKAQEQINLQNRDAFYPRIEALRAKINALKKDHDIVTQNLAEADRQSEITDNAMKVAVNKIQELRNLKGDQEWDASNVCKQINAAKPGTVLAEIEGLATQAEAKQKEIDRLFAEGNQLAANCGSTTDALAIKDRYNRIKALQQQIVQLKKTADQKNADLENLRRIVGSLKSRSPALATTDIADELVKAEGAARSATQLVMQVRGSVEVIETAKTQLRREIDALHAAAPEALLKDIQDQFNGLHGLLSSLTEHPPLVEYDEQAGKDLEHIRQIRQIQAEALRILQSWKPSYPCQTEIPSAEAALQRVNTALTMAAAEDAAPLLHKAQACEASGKCIPAINQARGLLEQLKIEEGEAAINQVRQAGCNVEGLMTALDYYRTIRDAAALLNNAKAQCKFQDAVTFAEKIPQSIQNQPAIASAITDIRAGAAAQKQVEQLITNTKVAADSGNSYAQKSSFEESRKEFAKADGYLAQADQAAAPFPCLAERVNRYKDEYNRLKNSANNLSGGRATSIGVISVPPTVEEIPDALDPGKPQPTNTPTTTPSRSNTPPVVEDIPDALDPGKPNTTVARNKPQVEDIPDALDPGKPKVASNAPQVEDIPDALDPGKPPVQPTPTNTPRSSGNKQTSSNKPKKEKKPRDPNDPGFWGRLGGAIREAMDPNNPNNQPSNNPPPSQPRRSDGGGGGNPPARSGGESSQSSSSAPDISGEYSGVLQNDERTITYSLTITRTGPTDWTGVMTVVSEEVVPVSTSDTPTGLGQNSGRGRVTRDGQKTTLKFWYNANPSRIYPYAGILIDIAGNTPIDYDGSSLTWAGNGNVTFYRR